MTVSLLTTKLYIPPLRPRECVVRRPRLIERLDEGLRLGHRLTLISAPAGFGKTTLLNEWISDFRFPISDFGSMPATDYTGEKPKSEVVRLIHNALTFLLDHLPPRMYLVIASRADPPLPLARLRAQDQLTELRADDLRFTPDEVAAFLNQVMGLGLSAVDIAALEARTEGWIAGLQLAALSLQGQDVEHIPGFIRAFAGSHRYILDYLVEEVLSRQPVSQPDRAGDRPVCAGRHWEKERV